MRQIREFLREWSLPYIITGDFNSSPHNLAEAGLLDGMHYHIVTPQGVAQTAAQHQTTCHSGNSATLIDYCVIDYRIASLCNCTAVTTPWKTHMGLIVQINATFDKLVARKGKGYRNYGKSKGRGRYGGKARSKGKANYTGRSMGGSMDNIDQGFDDYYEDIDGP